MLTHIVCYKFTHPTPENLQKAKTALLSMKGIVPEVIEIRAGADLVRSARSYDFALCVTVKDLDALAAYQSNEYHATKVKPVMHALMATSVSVDFVTD